MKKAGRRLSLEDVLTGPQALIWTKGLSMKLGRLVSGNKYGVSSMDTIEFITLDQILHLRAMHL